MNCRTQKLLNLGRLDSPQVLPANDTLCRLVQPGAIPIPREDFLPHTPRRKSVDRILMYIVKTTVLKIIAFWRRVGKIYSQLAAHFVGHKITKHVIQICSQMCERKNRSNQLG